MLIILKLGVGNSQISSSLTVNGTSSIVSSSPNSGSIYGGTVITIQGNGFDSGTVVSIGNAACNVISVSINQLTCKTSANAAAANLNFQIRYNWIIIIIFTYSFNIYHLVLEVILL
jgi:hypothetical protein